ncbi:MAG: dTDP-4-dehydrorhamnose reductase [Sphingobium sp.]
MITLITGVGGQVGRALVACAPGDVTVHALDRAALDLADPRAIAETVKRLSPDVIFNAAAYTAVDKAESEADIARAINVDAVAALANAAQTVGAQLVHISTDFVFDGSGGTPYPPDAMTSPLGVYGTTKRAGELAAGPDALIVRTAWVYASQGANFVKTMLRLMAERDEVRVVADQIGTPTWASSLAQALWQLHDLGARGIYHYTDSGVASWYDFALAIQEESVACGLLTRAVPIIPITTADFPTPARRPSCGVLDKQATTALLGRAAPHWRVNLRHMLGELLTHG